MNLPGVNFWLTTSGKTDFVALLPLAVDDEAEGLATELVEALSLTVVVGLSQNGMQRRRLAGRPPNTGSQSNDRFNVAHAIFFRVVLGSMKNKPFI